MGTKHVDGLDGTHEAKRRLRVILDTLVDRCSVKAACERLQVSESRFHQLRKEALEGALAGLAPRPSGRPPAEPPELESKVTELESKVRELRMDLQASRVRTEIALTMPHLLRDRKKKPKLRCPTKRGR
ncbi:MAG: helix-turn-helix domain-containing protein [Gammaproteobacteria bacterium]|nr:helix-turn-helix domain-containing protein [Gammaproteobacteria bacterium]